MGSLESLDADARNLADYLEGCKTSGSPARLTPELVATALKHLRSFVAAHEYHLESIASDGSLRELAVTDRPETCPAAYGVVVGVDQDKE